MVPWSDSQLVAPALLRNTLAAAISQQAGAVANDESLGGQFLHLAFPLAATEQSPFVSGGEPAVLVSAAGARLPAADEPTSPARINGFGRAILQSVSALEAGPTVPRPTSYLRWSGKLVTVLQLALYIAVYFVTPNASSLHIETSWARLPRQMQLPITVACVMLLTQMLARERREN